jgi:hypothetical protein
MEESIRSLQQEIIDFEIGSKSSASGTRFEKGSSQLFSASSNQ